MPVEVRYSTEIHWYPDHLRVEAAGGRMSEFEARMRLAAAERGLSLWEWVTLTLRAVLGC